MPEPRRRRRRQRVDRPRTSAPRAESLRGRARGGTAATRRSTQVMAGRAPGRGGEGRRRGGGAAEPGCSVRPAARPRGRAAVPSLLRFTPGLFRELGTAVGPAAGPSALRQGRERSREGWAGSGVGAWRAWALAGKRSGWGSVGGRAAQGVWFLEQFKVTLHIRALRPPLSDPGRGGAYRLPAPLAGSACLLLPLAQPGGVWAAPARLAPDWLMLGGRVGRDLSPQTVADWCRPSSDAPGVGPMGARGRQGQVRGTGTGAERGRAAG